MDDSPAVSAEIPPPVPTHDPLPTAPEGSGLRARWNRSLAFRLVATSLLPLLVALPLTLVSLFHLGGKRIDDILLSNMKSQLASARTHLQRVKLETGQRVAQLARSDRMGDLLQPTLSAAESQRLLRQAAEDANLDFLIVAKTDGRVLVATEGNPDELQLPATREVRQAVIGVANAGFARITRTQLRTLVPHIDAQLESGNPGQPDPGVLIIDAGAHFPLSVSAPDAVLYGGKILNDNGPLIAHMREVIYPVDALPDASEGIAALATGTTVVASSRQREGLRTLKGNALPKLPTPMDSHPGSQWRGRLDLGGRPYVVGLEILGDEGGNAVGTIQLAFPYSPYQRDIRLLIGSVGGMITLTMLLLTLAYRSTGQALARRLGAMGQTLVRIRKGERSARMQQHRHADELNDLTIAFNQMLNTIAEQDRAQTLAQQTIADEASRRRALFQHERDGVVILNANGTVFEANPKMAAMLGYKPREMTLLHVSDWEANFNAEEVHNILESLGDEGTIFETELRRKDGSRFPAEVSISKATWAHKLFIFASIRDISERKAAELELEKYRHHLELLVADRTKALNDRTEQLNTIFSLSPDGFVSFDRAGKVSSVNNAFLRMTSLLPKEVEGVSEEWFSQVLAQRCLNPASFPGVKAMRDAADTKGEAPGASVAGPDSASRRKLSLELSGPGNRVLELDLLSSESSFISHVLYVRDITRETEIDRMKSEFLSTAAHELRTPMASIYGFSELLLARKFNDDKRKDLLETISRQATRMSVIIDELLDLARIEARQGKDFVVEQLDLQEVVQTVVSDYKIPEGRHAPILGIGTAPLPIRADRGKLQQALLNLLSNAYKYSPNGGDVNIDCEMLPGQNRVQVVIRDHGMGMTPEQLSRVFERFYRADTSGHIPGTGLGMSIVKEIIEIHEGTVAMESEYGVGSRVIVTLPLDGAEPVTDTTSAGDNHQRVNAA